MSARALLPHLYTPAEVADAIGQSERYVTDRARAREWPHRRFARGQIRFTAEDYARVLELTRVTTSEAAPRPSFAPRSAARRRTA